MKLSETPKNFVKCGLCGWGFECIWTGLHSALKKGKKHVCAGLPSGCFLFTAWPVSSSLCIRSSKRKIYWYVESCIHFVSFVPNMAPENG